jgi:Ni,Fe-hydrogenase maturation factor
MGMKLPSDGDIHIFAVEVKELMEFSEKMSQPLEKAYPEFSEEIFREIRDLLKEKNEAAINSR